MRNTISEVTLRSQRTAKRKKLFSGRGDCVDEESVSVAGGWSGGSMIALFFAWEASSKLHLRCQDRDWWVFRPVSGSSNISLDPLRRRCSV